MDISLYKCSCNNGIIKKTSNKLSDGYYNTKIDPCLNCSNTPHIFSLKDYVKMDFIKNTLVNNIYEILNMNNHNLSNQMKDLFLLAEKVEKNSLKLDDWDRLKKKEVLVLNHDNGSFKKGDEFIFEWSDGLSLVVSNDGDNIYLDRASITFFHRKSDWVFFQ